MDPISGTGPWNISGPAMMATFIFAGDIYGKRRLGTAFLGGRRRELSLSIICRLILTMAGSDSTGKACIRFKAVGREKESESHGE